MTQSLFREVSIGDGRSTKTRRDVAPINNLPFCLREPDFGVTDPAWSNTHQDPPLFEGERLCGKKTRSLSLSGKLKPPKKFLSRIKTCSLVKGMEIKETTKEKTFATGNPSRERDEETPSSILLNLSCSISHPMMLLNLVVL